MTDNLRKKNSRQRGSWTHGHGEKKKHRGAGHRGGRGNAGSGKRGDAKKPSFWKDKRMAGKFGFTNPTTKKVTAISIAQLNVSIEKFVRLGVAKQDKNSPNKFSVDFTTTKYNKLLGTGKPLVAYDIIIAVATPGAIKKIESAKGTVVIHKAKELVKESASVEKIIPSSKKVD